MSWVIQKMGSWVKELRPHWGFKGFKKKKKNSTSIYLWPKLLGIFLKICIRAAILENKMASINMKYSNFYHVNPSAAEYLRLFCTSVLNKMGKF